MGGSYAPRPERSAQAVGDGSTPDGAAVSQNASAASRQNADIHNGDGDYDARNDEQVVDRGCSRERGQKGWSGVCHGAPFIRR